MLMRRATGHVEHRLAIRGAGDRHHRAGGLGLGQHRGDRDHPALGLPVVIIAGDDPGCPFQMPGECRASRGIQGQLLDALLVTRDHDLGVRHGQGQRNRVLARWIAGRTQQLDDARADEPTLALVAQALDGRAEAQGVAGVGQGHLADPEADPVAGIRHLLSALDELGDSKRSRHADGCQQRAGRRPLERVVAVVDGDRDERGAADPDGGPDGEGGGLVSIPGSGH
jgi:hypothetical protein